MAKDLWEIVDGKLVVHPHAGQKQMLESKARIVAVFAGTQSGKTSSGPLWLWREIQRCGQGDYLAVSASFDLLQLKMLPEMKRWFVEALGEYDWKAGDGVFQHKRDKTRIILRSAAAEGGLESATAKAAWLDECGQPTFTSMTWEAVNRRLSINQGRILITTTPYDIGWMKSAIYDRWTKGDKNIEVINFSSTMNPQFPQEEYDRMKKQMPRWRFEMFYDGKFTMPAGIIYDSFDSTKHVMPDFAVDRTWGRVVGVDFGYVHTCMVWCAHDFKTDTWYVIEESLAGGKTSNEHAEVARKMSEGYDVMFVGGAPSEEQQRVDWGSNGIPVAKPWIADVEAGIDRVHSLLRQGRLYVFESCEHTIEQFGTYSRKLNSRDEPTADIKDKKDFHYLDALRYAASAFEYSAKIPVVVEEKVYGPRSYEHIRATLKEKESEMVANSWY